MILDTDTDILNNSYDKWFESMYNSFGEQLIKSTGEYISSIFSMVAGYDYDKLRLYFPYRTTVRFLIDLPAEEFEKLALKETKTTYEMYIYVDVDNLDLTKSVENAMNTLISMKDFDYTKIKPV